MFIYKVYQYVDYFEDYEIDHGYYLKLENAITKWKSLINDDVYKFDYELFTVKNVYYVEVNESTYGVELIKVED